MTSSLIPWMLAHGILIVVLLFEILDGGAPLVIWLCWYSSMFWFAVTTVAYLFLRCKER